MKRYFMGIDGGASKTHFALYDRERGTIHLHTAPGSNYQVLNGGIVEFEQIIAEGTGAVLAHRGIGIEEVAAGGFGMAAMDSNRQHSMMSDIFRRIGYCSFALGNDSVLGVKAISPDGTGVAAVNGSGFSTVAIDDEGGYVQTGALGHYMGDKGGGGYYFEQVIQAVFEELFKEHTKTQMTPRILELFGASDRAEFIDALTETMEGDKRKAYYVSTSRILHTCALEGDEVAIDLLEESGACYARSIYYAAKNLAPLWRRGCIHVGLIGSNFTKCESTHAIDALKGELLARDPRFQVKVVRAQPVCGGILWALERAGLSVDAGERNRIHGALAI